MGGACKVSTQENRQCHKYHWNSTLQRWYMNLGRINSKSTYMVKDVGLDKNKASSEETLSCAEDNSFKSKEVKYVGYSEKLDNQSKGKESTRTRYIHESIEQPIHFLPVACISAFNVYNNMDELEFVSPCSRPVPALSHYIQTSKPDVGICKLLEGVYIGRLVPLQCGQGYCGAQNGQSKSLLGAEFVEFSETPSFPNYELAAIDADTSNLAWLKSGLESNSVRLVDDVAVGTTPHRSLDFENIKLMGTVISLLST